MKNIYLIPGAIIIAGIIIAGTFALTRAPQSASVLESSKAIQKDIIETPSETTEVSITDQDNIRGNVNAPITIVEFSDFECPFCAVFHPTVKQILSDYPNDVRWVYKHFPLDSIHLDARPAAEASECAGEQGKFWEFTDGLFENQASLGENLYTKLAQENGLNVSQFEACVSSRKYKDKVEADLQEGIKLGVNGTPGSFINGELVSGALPYANIKDIIEKILNK